MTGDNIYLTANNLAATLASQLGGDKLALKKASRTVLVLNRLMKETDARGKQVPGIDEDDSTYKITIKITSEGSLRNEVEERATSFLGDNVRLEHFRFVNEGNYFISEWKEWYNTKRLEVSLKEGGSPKPVVVRFLFPPTSLSLGCEVRNRNNLPWGHRVQVLDRAY